MSEFLIMFREVLEGVLIVGILYTFIVKTGKLDLSDKIIKLVYLGENEITVLFDKKTFNIKGWQIIDQYNNNIHYSLKVISKNDVFKKGTFKIPEIN